MIEQKPITKKGYVRKKGQFAGQVIGHYNVSMRLDIYNRFRELKERLDMSSETWTEFWLYVANLLEETHSKSDDETKAQEQLNKQGVKDIDEIMTMTDEEVEAEIARLKLDEEKDNDDNSNLS